MVPSDGNLVNVIGDLAGIAPVPVKPAQPNPTPGQAATSKGGNGSLAPAA